MKSHFNIGEASRESGVSAKLIRHYESIGLIPKAARTDSGYRLYSENDVHTLRFVRSSRSLGFSMKEIKTLLGLWKNRSRASREVKRLAQAHVEDLEAKIAELKAMTQTLKDLMHHCSGDDRPDCPILEGIGVENSAAAKASGKRKGRRAEK